MPVFLKSFYKGLFINIFFIYTCRCKNHRVTNCQESWWNTETFRFISTALPFYRQAHGGLISLKGLVQQSCHTYDAGAEPAQTSGRPCLTLHRKGTTTKHFQSQLEEVVNDSSRVPVKIETTQLFIYNLFIVFLLHWTGSSLWVGTGLALVIILSSVQHNAQHTENS